MSTIHPLGKKVRQLRMERAWTQKQAAAILQVSLRTLVTLENGLADMRPLTLAKVSLALKSLEKAA